MKYIIMRRKVGELIYLTPIIFPNQLVHKHVASALLNFGENTYNFENKVESAGDINMDVESTSGSSSTLNINAKSSDAKLINLIDYGFGII